MMSLKGLHSSHTLASYLIEASKGGVGEAPLSSLAMALGVRDLFQSAVRPSYPRPTEIFQKGSCPHPAIVWALHMHLPWFPLPVNHFMDSLGS